MDDGQTTEQVEPQDVANGEAGPQPVSASDVADAVVDAVEPQLRANGDAITILSSEVQQLRNEQATTNETQTMQVVALSDGQWQELHDTMVRYQQVSGVTLYLMLSLTLLVAAIFGNKLWEAFSKGWRK